MPLHSSSFTKFFIDLHVNFTIQKHDKVRKKRFVFIKIIIFAPLNINLEILEPPSEITGLGNDSGHTCNDDPLPSCENHRNDLNNIYYRLCILRQHGVGRRFFYIRPAQGL